MTGLLYKPWSIVFGLVGGMLANTLFAKLWAFIGDEKPPKPTQRDTTWKTVIPAAVLHGAVHAGVKAAAQRGSAKSFEAATGVWPVKDKKKKK